MNERQDLISYLEVVKQQFNPSDPLMLQALLYLFYSNYTVLQNQDEVFTRELLSLVEQCNVEKQEGEQDVTCCAPTLLPPIEELGEDFGLSGTFNGRPILASDPFTTPRNPRENLVPWISRALFFNGPEEECCYKGD